MDIPIELETLQFFWYVIFAAAVFAYAALDGFDIGVGCLHLFAKSDFERRIFLNSIGPVWDSNSLWVIISAGALLAGFPKVFATLLSTLYIPMLFLVFGYVSRGVAMEFRSKLPSHRWRQSWDIVFSFASFSLAFGFGVTLANLVQGLPINSDGALVGGVSSLFPPYAVSFGIFTTFLFMLHGALYLNMKTEGDLQQKIKRWLQTIYSIFLFLWSLITVLTLIYNPHMTSIYQQEPLFFLITFCGILGISLMPKLISARREGFAFLSSFLIIASLVGNLVIGMFPYLIRSSVDPTFIPLTIYNASASLLTMKILAFISILGVPLFILYIFTTYKIFRGKVELDSMSY